MSRSQASIPWAKQLAITKQSWSDQEAANSFRTFLDRLAQAQGKQDSKKQSQKDLSESATLLQKAENEFYNICVQDPIACKTLKPDLDKAVATFHDRMKLKTESCKERPERNDDILENPVHDQDVRDDRRFCLCKNPLS